MEGYVLGYHSSALNGVVKFTHHCDSCDTTGVYIEDFNDYLDPDILCNGCRKIIPVPVGVPKTINCSKCSKLMAEHVNVPEGIKVVNTEHSKFYQSSKVWMTCLECIDCKHVICIYERDYYDYEDYVGSEEDLVFIPAPPPG